MDKLYRLIDTSEIIIFLKLSEEFKIYHIDGLDDLQPMKKLLVSLVDHFQI